MCGGFDTALARLLNHRRAWRHRYNGPITALRAVFAPYEVVWSVRRVVASSTTAVRFRGGRNPATLASSPCLSSRCRPAAARRSRHPLAGARCSTIGMLWRPPQPPPCGTRAPTAPGAVPLPVAALSTAMPTPPPRGGLDTRSLALAARPPEAGGLVHHRHEPAGSSRDPLPFVPMPTRSREEVSTPARWRSLLDHRRADVPLHHRENCRNLHCASCRLSSRSVVGEAAGATGRSHLAQGPPCLFSGACPVVPGREIPDRELRRKAVV